MLRRHCRWLAAVKARAQLTFQTRDKETYFVQRVILGKIEHDAINKYVQKAEATFETNWLQYEAQLKKYLTASTK